MFDNENNGLSDRVAQIYLDGIRGVSCGGFHSSCTHIPESGAQQQQATVINIDKISKYPGLLKNPPF